jgi:alanyl aminopeptidase
VLVDGANADVTLDAGSDCPTWVLPNAGGSGYYRFALDGAGWNALLQALPQLDDGSALASANNFIAAFTAGKLDAATLAGGLERIFALEAREAVFTPKSLLWSIDQQLLGDAARPGWRKWLAAQYAPRFAELGYHADTARDRENPTEAALWRSALVQVLGETARDPATTAELSHRAARFLDGGAPGVLRHEALDPGIVGSALNAAVRERGAPFFDALLEDLLASSDTSFQFRAAMALGRTEDPALAARVRELLLDPRLSSLQVMGLASGQSQVVSEQDELLDWLDQNMDALAGRLSQFSRSDLPWFAASHCSTEGAARVQAVFGSRAVAFGAEIALAQVVEGIELCAARKARYGGELEQLFGAGDGQ